MQKLFVVLWLLLWLQVENLLGYISIILHPYSVATEVSFEQNL